MLASMSPSTGHLDLGLGALDADSSSSLRL